MSITQTDTAPEPGFWDGSIKFIKQLMCKHYWMEHRSEDRLCLKCPYCGDETTGWDVTPKRPL